MAIKTVVALPGQGIGPEVVDATCELLMGTNLELKILTPPQDDALPEETKRAAREADGVPTATIRSAVLMLEHMGMGVEAQRLDAAPWDASSVTARR